MTPLFLHALHGLAVTKIPHATALLDAFNPQGRLRVADLNIQRTDPSILAVELRVTGLDPVEAERWATERALTRFLRLQTPLRQGRAGTLWLGRVRFDQDTPAACLQLELPFLAVFNPNDRDCWVTLTTSADVLALDAWAKERRTAMAEASVERVLQPILQQLDEIGVEAVAIGLRTAMRGIEPLKSTSLLGCVAPVLYIGWLAAWAKSLSLCAPLLQRLEAEIGPQDAPDDALGWQPMVERLQFVSRSGESLWVNPRNPATYWLRDDHASELAQLRALTGASLDAADAVVSFIDDCAALVLLKYRANGATSEQLPPRQGQ